MSSRTTRCSALSAFAICVQFLPWPKSPWQKTTRVPVWPSSVRCRLTRPSSRIGSGRCDVPLVGEVDQAVAGRQGQGALEAPLLPPATADQVAQPVGLGGALGLQGADDLAHLVEDLPVASSFRGRLRWGHGAHVATPVGWWSDQALAGSSSAVSGCAMSSSDWPSARTPRKISAIPPRTISAAPTK